MLPAHPLLFDVKGIDKKKVKIQSVSPNRFTKTESRLSQLVTTLVQRKRHSSFLNPINETKTESYHPFTVNRPDIKTFPKNTGVITLDDLLQK